MVFAKLVLIKLFSNMRLISKFSAIAHKYITGEFVLYHLPKFVWFIFLAAESEVLAILIILGFFINPVPAAC